MSATRLVSALVLLAMAAGTVLAAPAGPVKLYVSPQGKDTWTGRSPELRAPDGPFATVERARDEIRILQKAGPLPRGGAVVQVAGGVYELARPIELTADDSGTRRAPITYRAAPGAQVRLVGGKVLTGWQRVSDPAMLARLDPAARGHVYQTDLKAQGVTDFGELKPTGAGASRVPVVELFFGDQPMMLSRWPNEGFVKVANVIGGDSVRHDSNARLTTSGQITMEGDRWKRWLSEKDPWLHGYWEWDWADQRQKVANINPDTGVISLAKPFHYYGYKSGQRYYAFNMLSEIDTPGEWYLDRQAGALYFWPPTAIERGHTTLSVLPSFINMNSVSNLMWQGFTFDAARGTAINITGGDNCRVAGCTILNAGNWAVWIVGGTNHGVEGCDIYQTGDGGVYLGGGDRKTLTPSGHYVDNCHIHHYSRINRICNPAVRMDGVGTRVTHNLIDNAPHCAIMFGGNDHVIEFNEMHSVCYEASDAGAIYCGRSWSMRGNVMRYNYMHHIQGLGDPGTRGIYLDDLFAGGTVTGNIFYKVNQSVLFSGRDNSVVNNIFVDCSPAVWCYFSHCFIDTPETEEGRTMVKSVTDMPYKDPPWSTAYPLLVNILDDQPFLPKRDVISRNICFGGSLLRVTEEKGRPYLQMENNLEGVDPHFVDAAHGNFQLRADSPAWKLGFQRIPSEKIGLYQDPLRVSWPAQSPLRPMVMPAPKG